MIDGPVLPVDPRALEANAHIEPFEAIGTLYRVALLQLCLGSEKIRKEWTDPDGWPKPELLQAAAQCRLRYRHRNVTALRNRVVELALSFRGFGQAAE